MRMKIETSMIKQLLNTHALVTHQRYVCQNTSVRRRKGMIIIYPSPTITCKKHFYEYL